MDLTTQLRLTDISHLMEMNPAGELPRLYQLLKRLKKGIQALGDQIIQHYLSRIETEQQMRISFDSDALDDLLPWKISVRKQSPIMDGRFHEISGVPCHPLSYRKSLHFPIMSCF